MFKILIVAGGFIQLAIAITSLAIPHLLDWRRELAVLQPLTRSVFWTYAGYVLGTNVCFGIVSIGWSSQLLAGTSLAALVTGFIAVYWLVRVVGQFAWYERSVAATRALFRVAEALYVGGFVFVTVVFAAAAVHNLAAVLQ